MTESCAHRHVRAASVNTFNVEVAAAFDSTREPKAWTLNLKTAAEMPAA